MPLRLDNYVALNKKKVRRPSNVLALRIIKGHAPIATLEVDLNATSLSNAAVDAPHSHRIYAFDYQKVRIIIVLSSLRVLAYVMLRFCLGMCLFWLNRYYIFFFLHVDGAI